MKIASITCTGDRPEALALCQKWMEMQSRPADFWWLFDDGKTSSTVQLSKVGTQISHELLKPIPSHSLDRNLNFALAMAARALDRGHLQYQDLICFVEDDDAYRAGYFEAMHFAHTVDPSVQMVGEECSLYYNLPERKYRVLSGRPYAALCQTVIKASLINHALIALKEKLPEETFDVALWKHCHRLGISRRLIPGDPLVVGIKGMPGRPGIGRGHYAENLSDWTNDPELEILKHAVGNEELYGHYIEISKAQAAPSVQCSISDLSGPKLDD